MRPLLCLLSKQMIQITSDVSHMVHLCEQKLMKSKIELNGKWFQEISS